MEDVALQSLLNSMLGRAQANLLAEPAMSYEKGQYKSPTLPDDMFEDIIGHDDVKELLTAMLLSDSITRQ